LLGAGATKGQAMGVGEESTVMPGTELVYSEAKLAGTKALAKTRNCTGETRRQ
jgi:hypothetical protein